MSWLFLSFNVHSPVNSISYTFRRAVEYCQWTEHWTETTETYGAGENEEKRVTRQYYYVKSWHSYRTNSFLFDQPAAHHNPQYDPFPSTEMATPSLKVSDRYVVENDLVQKAIPFSTKNTFSYEEIDGFLQSPAFTQMNVRYIGNGYFYYTSVASTLEKVLRFAGMAVEGSLMDFQASLLTFSHYIHSTATQP